MGDLWRTICGNCGNVAEGYFVKCPKCGSDRINRFIQGTECKLDINTMRPTPDNWDLNYD